MVVAYALDKEYAKLRLPLLDVINKQLAPVKSAVRGIQDTHCTVLVEQVIKELVECLKSNLLPDLRSRLVFRIEKLGRLIHELLIAACISVKIKVWWRVQVQYRGLFDLRSLIAVEQDGGNLFSG